MIYFVSQHAIDRFFERFGGRAINSIDAQNVINGMIGKSVKLRKGGHRPNIVYYLDTSNGAVFVINTENRVVITVYNIRKGLIEGEVDL